jgi:hypothetical protein
MNDPTPWRAGTGRYGLYCSRILKQHEAGALRALLPLVIIQEEELPVAGDKLIILTAPVRGIPFVIARVEISKLNDLTDFDFKEMGISRADYLIEWDRCNSKHPARINPKVMLLWLFPWDKVPQKK